MSPLIRLTPPRLAKRRMAGFVMPCAREDMHRTAGRSACCPEQPWHSTATTLSPKASHLDVVSQHLPVTLGATFTEALASFAPARHNVTGGFGLLATPGSSWSYRSEDRSCQGCVNRSQAGWERRKKNWRYNGRLVSDWPQLPRSSRLCFVPVPQPRTVQYCSYSPALREDRQKVYAYRSRLT